MSSSQLKLLKPLIITEWDVPQKQARVNLLNPIWENIRKYEGPEFRHLIQTIYYAVLDYYVNNKKPMPLAVLNRSYTKSLNTLVKRTNIGLIKITDFLHLINISDSAPIGLSPMRSGALGILPKIAAQTVMSRGMRGEPTCDILTLVLGDTEGPELSPAGMKLAYAPFDELELPAQKFDIAPKAAEPQPILTNGGTND